LLLRFQISNDYFHPATPRRFRQSPLRHQLRRHQPHRPHRPRPTVGVADLHHLPVHPIITGQGTRWGARLTSDTPCSVIVCVTCPRSRHLRFVATPALKSCGGGRYRGVLRTKKSSRVTG
ncbi:unnamed protein product, partial [Gadus morhua 'NCC']